MDEYDYYDELKKHALDNDNYKNWRKVHKKAFGDLFENAFSQNEEAQILLTEALIYISQRKFDLAATKLDMLEQLCDNRFDDTAIYYFKGLNYEMLGNESMMTEYYEKLKSASALPKFPLAFHPYCHTAKFAQRDSECTKSMHYYLKALEFYDGVTPDYHVALIASDIIYNIATLCLYMHEYDECERFLELSYQYDESQNHQRDYVKSVLLAVQGKRYECAELLETLPPFLRENCQAATDAIFSGKDPHYCKVSQDRSLYEDFWISFLHDEPMIKNMIINGNIDAAEESVSQKLTKALGFMKRTLDCRIEKNDESIIISCKNYRVSSLIEEYAALFSLKPESLSSWKFVSVDEFERNVFR